MNRLGAIRLISPPHLHAHTMGRTCRRASEIEVTAAHASFNGSCQLKFMLYGLALQYKESVANFENLTHATE